MKNKKVIIIGGGIAGCVLALSLNKIGMKSEVFEARHTPKDDMGLFHYLSSNAMNVYKVLGIHDKLYDLGHVCNGVIHYNEKGKHPARIDEKDSLQDYGANSIMIKREFLTKILISSCVNSRGIFFVTRYITAEGDIEFIPCRPQ